MNKQPEKSKIYLRWLRGDTGDLTEELESLKKEVESEASKGTISKMYIAVRDTVEWDIPNSFKFTNK